MAERRESHAVEVASAGTIEAGKAADIVATPKDPREDIETPLRAAKYSPPSTATIPAGTLPAGSSERLNRLRSAGVENLGKGVKVPSVWG